MKKIVIAVTALAIGTGTLAPAAIADDKDDVGKVIAGALVLLGAAALAHNKDHHHDGKHHTQVQQIHDFDRGYRDGLHNAEYDFRHDSPEYNDGFAAGQKERHNQLAHRHPREGDGPNAPALAMRACVGEASAKWGRNPRDISVIKTRQAGSNDFYVEVAAGHRHGNCEVSADGNIYLFQKGRI